jgi:extracellular factor (EF) 3-hydroxypalmitic acid methyl ester biosynthesis protein
LSNLQIRKCDDHTFHSVSHGDRPATRIGDCAELLDATYTMLAGGDEVADAVWRLCYGLSSIRAQASEAEWKSVIKCCREHPLLPILHQDPYAARAFRKPRGYPGDAAVIDYLYRASPTREERLNLTPLGLAILQANTTTPSGFAVRERKRSAAREIDLVAGRKPGATVVAMAAGHARELAISAAMRSPRIARFLALDHDERSLDVIRTDYGALGVECLPVSVHDLLQGLAPIDDADLIYALGLYDYIPELVAQRLTAVLFDMLAPGGRLLIANFTPGIVEAGYMEAVADWFLIYRSSQQLRQLSAELPAELVGARELWIDDVRCVAYLRITKAYDA